MNESSFWKNVDRGGEAECWPWRGPLAACGAGIVYLRRPIKSSALALRVAWALSGRGA
jgi:hypothetical protein